MRIWGIHSGDKLAELQPARVDLEERLESRLEQEISIISEDLLVIGRQVNAGSGGSIGLAAWMAVETP